MPTPGECYVHHAVAKSDTKGSFTVRAFYGDYRITVTDSRGHTATRSVTMPEAGGPHTFRLTLP